MAIGFVALLGACAEDTDLSYYDDIAPKIVIQGQLSPDSTFRISITASQSPINTEPYTVPENMTVSFISSTGSVVDLYRENDLYIDPQAYPVAGESYTLIITAPGYKSVEARTSIPELVELESQKVINLRLEESEVTAEKMNVLYDLRLYFKPHNHQYFHFSFIQTTRINEGTIDSPRITEIAYYINPQFPDADGYYQHHETGVLIDALKTHASDSISFSFVDYTLGAIEELGILYVEVRTVTPEYYHYFTSLARQLISREDPFAEPIPVFNNIKNGLGNLSGFNRHFYDVEIVP